MVGRVITSQEKLKLIDKTHRREGTINFGKGVSGRKKMKENRTVKVKNVLKNYEGPGNNLNDSD